MHTITNYMVIFTLSGLCEYIKTSLSLGIVYAIALE